MSGGHFDYKQYTIDYIADEIESVIARNDPEEEDERGYHFNDQTLAELKRAVNLLRQAAIYAQRIDWLVSGDDAENTFHKRLQDELKSLKYVE